jgi:hypothetical protein
LFPDEKCIKTMWNMCGKHCTRHITWKRNSWGFFQGMSFVCFYHIIYVEVVKFQCVFIEKNNIDIIFM